MPIERLLERLTGYPMMRERVEAGRLVLHGRHQVIDGQHFIAATCDSLTGESLVAMATLLATQTTKTT